MSKFKVGDRVAYYYYSYRSEKCSRKLLYVSSILNNGVLLLNDNDVVEGLRANPKQCRKIKEKFTSIKMYPFGISGSFMRFKLGDVFFSGNICSDDMLIIHSIDKEVIYLKERRLNLIHDIRIIDFMAALFCSENLVEFKRPYEWNKREKLAFELSSD